MRIELQKIGQKLLDAIYPRCCPVCHDIVVPSGSLICDKCMEKLEPICGPRCMRCGKALRMQEQEYCSDCTHYEHKFLRGMGIYPYNQIMKKSIEKYKFQNRREYADFYGAAMAHYGKPFIDRAQPQCLIPVPMLPGKERRRGFNQSECLALKLGEIMNIPVESHAVMRVRGGKNQKELNAAQRRRNLKGAFALTGRPLPYERVMLIDDVYTTGSTMDALAETVMEAGEISVYFLTLCQGKGL